MFSPMMGWERYNHNDNVTLLWDSKRRGKLGVKGTCGGGVKSAGDVVVLSWCCCWFKWGWSFMENALINRTWGIYEVLKCFFWDVMIVCGLLMVKIWLFWLSETCGGKLVLLGCVAELGWDIDIYECVVSIVVVWLPVWCEEEKSCCGGVKTCCVCHQY